MNNKPWTPYHYRPDAETVLKHEQAMRSLLRWTITGIVALVTGAALLILVYKIL